MTVVLEGFAGAGGWSEALQSILNPRGWNTWGWDNSVDACLTAHAAGHQRFHADVRYADRLNVLLAHWSQVDGIIMSPPCPAFSVAGKHGARADAGRITGYLNLLLWNGPEKPVDIPTGWNHEGSGLILEPLRWVKAVKPRWVALEQTPRAEAAFIGMAAVLRSWGYKTWVGMMDAERYGVAQTRRRVVLIASMSQQPMEPAGAFHMRFDTRVKQVPLRPPVSMADKLEWIEPHDYIGFARRVDPGRAAVTFGGVQYRARDFRRGYDPAFTLTGKARSWKVYDWAGELKGRLSVEDLSVLQSFRRDYPWQGSRTSAVQQIADTVPPLLARAVLVEAMRQSPAIEQLREGNS